MDFGEAIRALKEDKCVARQGWNGKGMHIYLEEHFTHVLQGGHFKGAKRPYEAVIIMFTAQGTHQPGWLASQADMLSDDWEIVDPDSQD